VVSREGRCSGGGVSAWLRTDVIDAAVFSLYECGKLAHGRCELRD
jgi:hypothetical protein